MPVVTRRRSAELAALEARNVRPRTLVAHRPSKPQIFASEEQLFNEDIWTIIVGFLKALDLTSLALTSRFFHPIAMDDRVWKSLCMRHLQVAAPVSISPGLTWRRLYLSVFDPTHDFVRENEMHIDWRRVGIFTMTSGKALAAGRLWQATPEVSAAALCLIPYVRPGVWIADLHILHCPVCKKKDCEGTMQTIQARNWELFHYKDYQDGTWQYIEVASKRIQEKLDAAAGGVFDYQPLVDKDMRNAELLDFKRWGGDKLVACVSPFAAAASTPLSSNNQGLVVKFSVLRAGKDGPVMSIRIAQQLI